MIFGDSSLFGLVVFVANGPVRTNHFLATRRGSDEKPGLIVPIYLALVVTDSRSIMLPSGRHG